MPMSFICTYPDGSPLPLALASEYGCTLSLTDDEETAFAVIQGIIDASIVDNNVMNIDILSTHTKNLSECMIYYRPYITIRGNTYRWQGRITLGATTPFR